jgi:hypothetical protein
MTPVIAYVRPDEPPLQLAALLAYIEERGLTIVASCREPGPAAEAVTAGLASVVVASVDPRNGLRSAVAGAGGTLWLVRGRAHLASATDLLRLAVRRGRTPHEIADSLGADTTDVRELLKRIDSDGRPN